VVYLEGEEEAGFSASRLRGPLRATWLDPRTGKTSVAKGAGRNRHHKPDGGDWVLHLKAD